MAGKVRLVFVRFLAVFHRTAEGALIRMAKFMAFERPFGGEQLVADIALEFVFLQIKSVV